MRAALQWFRETIGNPPLNAGMRLRVRFTSGM